MNVSENEYRNFLESLKIKDLRNLIRQYHTVVKISATKKSFDQLIELILSHTVLKKDGNIYLKPNMFKLHKDKVIKKKGDVVLPLAKQREKLLVQKFTISGKIKNLNNKLSLAESYLLSGTHGDQQQIIDDTTNEIDALKKKLDDITKNLVEVNNLYELEKKQKK